MSFISHQYANSFHSAMPIPLAPDSDDEDDLPLSSFSVLLGVPDGNIDDVTDLSDPVVSRIGGLPAFVKGLVPPITDSYCRVCSNPMELLVQLWCPLENSPMDRSLYIWGCPRAGCQRKPSR